MGRSVKISASVAAVALAIALAGCSSIIGQSTYGSNRLDVADVQNIGDYNSERSLSEARAHFRNSDFGYSAAMYKRYVDLNPKDAEGYIGLGASYDRLGRFDLSDRVYATLFQISGGSAQYYNNLGYSYMLRGNLTLALTNFRKAKAIDPSNSVVANNLQILANTAASAKGAKAT